MRSWQQLRSSSLLAQRALGADSEPLGLSLSPRRGLREAGARMRRRRAAVTAAVTLAVTRVTTRVT
jgi:hypothetical protein